MQAERSVLPVGWNSVLRSVLDAERSSKSFRNLLATVGWNNVLRSVLDAERPSNSFRNLLAPL